MDIFKQTQKSEYFPALFKYFIVQIIDNSKPSDNFRSVIINWIFTVVKYQVQFSFFKKNELMK